MTQTILRLDASARNDGSRSRALADALLARLPGATVTRRDLALGIPQITEGFVTGTFTPPDARSREHNEDLALSDRLVAELIAADTLLIATATYNFNIPASLKAWIDQVARAGVTFRYTESGPEGLLKGKRAVILRASSGTPTGSDHDFATPYLAFALGFLGITDVVFLDTPAPGEDAEATLQRALDHVAPALAA